MEKLSELETSERELLYRQLKGRPSESAVANLLVLATLDWILETKPPESCNWREKYREELEMRLPPLTQVPMLHVDLTPNDDLALRILRAYRQNCEGNWAEDTNGGPVRNPLLLAMNEDNRQRAVLLDKAIAILEAVRPVA